jgi:hypothetical protein
MIYQLQSFPRKRGPRLSAASELKAWVPAFAGMTMRGSLLTAVLFSVAACSESQGPNDYIKIAGGGLVFNYRYSQATMVVVIKQVKQLPEGGKLEALFDLPGLTARDVQSRPVLPGKLTYKLESSILEGIKKGEALKVTIRLLDADQKELEIEETSFTSDVDQSTLPSKPLVDPSKPNYVPQLENLE